MRAAAQLAVPVILPRAFVLWGLIRLAFAALPLAAGAMPGSIAPPPIAVVLLCGLVGLIDVRLRGEDVLWANLGVTRVGLCATYVVAAIPAECVLAFVLR